MWRSVTLISDAAHVEALGDALMEAGALSVAVEDADAGTDRETPQFGEPGAEARPLWATSRLVVLFDARVPVDERIREAASVAGLPAPPAYTVQEVEEQDWVRLTQSQFEPIRINDRLWIVPSWHAAPDSGAINIALDPGLAFGTGSHPTTRLCLDWLCQAVRPGLSVLDYGCGSGILAIAAAKLGAEPVHAVDIDEQALASTQENARANAVQLVIGHSAQPLDRRFDRVVANILTNPLRVLAPLLAGTVAPGGALALSGILASQAGEVIEAYRPYIALEVGAELDGWVRLQGSRP